jgi:hypothetical protein
MRMGSWEEDLTIAPIVPSLTHFPLNDLRYGWNSRRLIRTHCKMLQLRGEKIAE